ncbi:MAG: adenylate/guanylate cyclase domain-containing protein [Candidatus Latescibacteria bacterium]|nr:adenylate/guanylate cyclase domain-containing protein [Candidatus Latescibacterota bacterium]
MTEKRQIISLLFADVAGYAKIADDPLYAKLKQVNAEFEKRFLHSRNHFKYNTWGDAFFICSYDPMDAAEIALDLRDYYRNQNWRRLGFPEPLSIRIGLHAARATIILDGENVRDIVGVSVNTAARIEPVVEENQVYCSDIFRQHLSQDPNTEFKTEQLGEIELAKQFGKMLLHRLMRSYEAAQTAPAPAPAPVVQGSPTGTKAPQQGYALLLVGEKIQIVPADHVEYDDKVRLLLRPQSPAVAAFLSALRDAPREGVGTAWGNTALLAKVEAISQVWQNGQEKWSVVLVPEKIDSGVGMEMATSNYSADQLAEIRARRILLNEKLAARGNTSRAFTDDTILEVLIRGQSTPLKVEASPLPKLYKELRSEPDLFLATARLVAILWLRLSGVIEHVFHLDFRLREDWTLEVNFSGQRARRYGNVDPPIIEVSGLCDLSR